MRGQTTALIRPAQNHFDPAAYFAGSGCAGLIDVPFRSPGYACFIGCFGLVRQEHWPHPNKKQKGNAMPQISIPESLVVPLDEVADGISGLRIVFVNVFALSHADGRWTMIDAGLPLSATYIANWAEKHHTTPPRAIVLTHGHFDHVSAAKELAQRWNISIYAHPQEFPYLTGEREYPPPDFGAGGGLMSLLSPLYPRGPIQLGDRLQPLDVSTGNAVADFMDEWDVVPTPGHTPGHVSFFRSSERALLAGDAFCTTKPESFFDAALTQSPELHGPPAYFTPDWTAASASIHKLADLEPTIVAPGHGKPLAGEGVANRLRRLATQFSKAA
jgi:glyoxylase-like metal-dependent hydrolase (beta-lactamase superfamily II)